MTMLNFGPQLNAVRLTAYVAVSDVTWLPLPTVLFIELTGGGHFETKGDVGHSLQIIAEETTDDPGYAVFRDFVWRGG